jgi:pyrroloquinoline quinone (PQQ) biosynthesis protein C
MRRSNPLFYKAEDGTLTSRNISQYLANVHYLITHTPIHLARARDRARAVGDEPLAKHYSHKMGEEVGHDEWAERDISRVAPLLAAPVKREVSASMRTLVEYVAGVIDEDPTLYLAYILFTEHLMVVGGAEWLQLLEERCGIPRSAMTVVGNHVELDREHVEEALETIDDLVGDPRKLPRMRRVIEETISLFERFCVEVTETEAPHDNRPAPSASRHVSAA